MTTINKDIMDSINTLLTSIQVKTDYPSIYEDNKNKSQVDYNLICQGTRTGKFNIDRANISRLFDLIGDVENCDIGLSEKPQKYSMLRCDFDFCIDEQNTFELNRKRLNNYIYIIQIFLKNHIHKYQPKHSDCVILSKTPYTKNDKIKNGYHLAFVNTFLHIDAFKKIEEYLENEFKSQYGDNHGFDKIASKCWLMTNMSKGLNLEAYKPTEVICEDGLSMEVDDYLFDYKVYDKSEMLIKYTKPMKFYYPRIFSINPFGRDNCVEFNPLPVHPSTIEKRSKQINREINRPVVDIENVNVENILNMVNCLDDNRWIETASWRALVWYLTSINIDDTTIHEFSEKAGSIYDYKATQNLITYFDPEKYNGSVATLCMYYKEDTGNKPLQTTLTKEEFKMEYSFKPSILNPIKPNKIINQNNIGSYLTDLQEYKTLGIKSACMTFKTYNTSELIKTNAFNRILILSSRRTLSSKLEKDFREFGVVSYMDIKGQIDSDKYPRVIVQIDSIDRVVGEFDIIICDEVNGIYDHLFGFKELAYKRERIFDVFNNYIENTPYALFMDALLDKNSVSLFERRKDKPYIIQNNWKSFAGYKYEVIYDRGIADMVLYIKKQHARGKRIYVPTNSQIRGQDIYDSLILDGINVGFAHADNNIPVENWGKYDIFITSPTFVAGTSFNEKHFDISIGYGTTDSCSASNMLQMFLRVRNLNDKHLVFFFKPKYGYNPTSLDKIKSRIRDKYNLYSQSGLKLNNYKKEYIEDDLFHAFIQYTRKTNIGIIHYVDIIVHFFKEHGMIEETLPFTEISLIENEAEKVNLKQIKTKRKEIHNIEVKNAPCLTSIEFKQLASGNVEVGIDNRNAMVKYKLMDTYKVDEKKIDDTFTENLEKRMKHFKALTLMNTKHLQKFIEFEINEQIRNPDHNKSEVHLYTDDKPLKLWLCHHLVKVCGFKSVFDTKTVVPIFKYDEVLDFCKNHGAKIQTLFNCSQLKWDKLDLEDKHDKKKLLTFVNTRLFNVLGIRIQGKSKLCINYKINGLEVFDKFDIKIPKNKFNINERLLTNSPKPCADSKVIQEISLQNFFAIKT